MDAMMKKRSGSAKKENKQPGRKKKAKSPVSVSSKAQSQQEKKAEKEREEKKKEKMEKKKALDERDLNILGQLSQLNWSFVVMNEHGRDVEEKDRELARKKYDFDRREKEVERKEGTHAHNLHEVNEKNVMRTWDLSEITGPSWRIIEENDEDDEEYLGTGR